MASKKEIYIFILFGLLLGFTLDFLYRHVNLTLFYYSFITLFCLLYSLAYNDTHRIRLIASSFIVALLLSLPLLPLKINYDSFGTDHWISFLCAFPIFSYVGHSFHYAYHHDNTWKINYSSLFAAVWNTVPLLFIGSVFLSLANLLILLGAVIFQTLDYEYLWNLYFNIHFRLISNTTLFFIGLGVGQQNIKIIHNLRFLLLRMMYYLFPFLALISIIYFILFLGHPVSQKPGSINSLLILIPLVSTGILFFNAYYQDGNPQTGITSPPWLKLFLKVYRVILLLLTLMMTYRIFHENSLDINIVIYVVAIISYSLIYAVTACISQTKEQKWIQTGNICTALFFIIALFLLNLPYMPIAFNVGTEETAIPNAVTSQPH